MTAIAKFTYVRSKKLMEMYRTIACQNCGCDNGTVCGAHSNQAKHGKGKGIKASDQFCASLCSLCHALCDYGNMARAESVAMWNKAHEKTVKLLTKIYGDVYLTLVGYVIEEPAKVEW